MDLEHDIQAAIDEMAENRNLPDESEQERVKLERRRAAKAREIAGRVETADLPQRQLETANAGKIDVSGKFGQFLDKAGEKVANGATFAILGNRGTGKTQLAVCIAMRAAEKGGVLYLTAFDFFLRIREAFSRESKKTERQILAELTSIRFLILDELQERGESAWEDRLLTSLIDRRYRDKRATMLLANLSESEFRKSIGPNAEDRLREGGGIAVLDGESRRK